MVVRACLGLIGQPQTYRLYVRSERLRVDTKEPDGIARMRRNQRVYSVPPPSVRRRHIYMYVDIR